MRRIKLTRGKFALVSDADFARVNAVKWHALKTRWGNWYARHCGTLGKCVYMHRFILGVPSTAQVDHAPNFDGLDNRRCNLRVASNIENQRNHRKHSNNKSGFKGVSQYKRTPKWWIAHIQNKHLGYFSTPQKAARAYDRAAVKLFGRFACTNKSLGLL